MRVNYKDLVFAWDEDKNIKNTRKHKVTFFEGITVFDDDNALYEKDEDHSEAEDRFRILGESDAKRLLLVCHCCRDNDAVIRIISVRKATRHEKKRYGDAE